MEHVQWPHIQSFLAIARHKSLSAAAVALGSSQPTLGRHLRSLESELDLRLFDRTSSGLELTEAGLDLLSHADAMSKAASDFELAASGRSDRISGSVCITASMAFSSQFLPSILTKLRDQEPDLEIELIASDESGNLLLREADIAVRMFQPTQPDLIARKVGHIEMGAFASTEYLEHFGTPRDLSELKNHVVIGTLKRDYSRQVLRELGLETNSSFFKLRCDDPNVAWQMVLAGYGIGFTHLEFGVREPSVQRVGENLPTVTLPIWLTSHAQLRESKSIRRVFDFLAEEITSISNQ